MPEPQTRLLVHPLVVRITHWINAFAMVCMVMSGWAIYNASPFFPFRFPAWATVGGWLGGSIAWHFAAMWLLCANGLLYLAYGIGRGHFRRKLLPVHPRDVRARCGARAALRLPHDTGKYNAVQRALYLLVLCLACCWWRRDCRSGSRCNSAWLTALFGGFDFARRVHFIAMAGVVGFVVVHLALVLLVPRTLLPMLTGPRTASAHEGSQA